MIKVHSVLRLFVIETFLGTGNQLQENVQQFDVMVSDGKKKPSLKSHSYIYFFLSTTCEQKQLTGSTIYAHYDTTPTTGEGLTHVQNFLQSMSLGISC